MPACRPLPGRPDTRSEALRLRLDWFDAATLGPAAFTPYASLSRLRSRVDACSESGGGFPAAGSGAANTRPRSAWGSTRSPGRGGVNFVGRLEAARRSDARAADTRGEVSGCSPSLSRGGLPPAMAARRRRRRGRLRPGQRLADGQRHQPGRHAELLAGRGVPLGFLNGRSGNRNQTAAGKRCRVVQMIRVPAQPAGSAVPNPGGPMIVRRRTWLYRLAGQAFAQPISFDQPVTATKARDVLRRSVGNPRSLGAGQGRSAGLPVQNPLRLRPPASGRLSRAGGRRYFPPAGNGRPRPGCRRRKRPCRNRPRGFPATPPEYSGRTAGPRRSGRPPCRNPPFLWPSGRPAGPRRRPGPAAGHRHNARAGPIEIFSRRPWLCSMRQPRRALRFSAHQLAVAARSADQASGGEPTSARQRLWASTRASRSGPSKAPAPPATSARRQQAEAPHVHRRPAQWLGKYILALSSL